MDRVIEIESFNPFENHFPNRKLITRDTLKLIKHLRQQGYDVVVLPKNDTPVEYLFRKGIQDIFSNPVYMFLIGLPTGIIINIISNYIQKALDGNGATGSIINVTNNFYIESTTENKIYNLNNTIIHDSQRKDSKKKHDKIKKEFSSCLDISSPYSDLRVPIFLEHQPKIIGWCNLKVDETGIIIEDSRIVDKNVFRKIKTKKIKGASITGIAEKSTCSICKKDYVDCIHISGEDYGADHCTNTIEKATAIEISLVKNPVNTNCIVSIIDQNK